MAANGYETTVQVPSFSGIYQGGGERGAAMKFAFDGENFSTKDGLLRSMDGGSVHANAMLDAPIGTLMLLYRRFRMEGNPYSPAVFVAVAGGKVYARSIDAAPDVAWEERYSGLTNDRFDYITYETNTWWTTGDSNLRVDPRTEGAIEVEAENPVDVLIMSNGDDGMFVVYGDSLEVVPFRIQPSTTAVEKKFGVLTRHAERIWGAAIPDQPDMLMYSAPYDPLDWEQNNEFPEDGAGDIMQPSWDGDSFVALRPYGSYLLAIKKNRIWRITGTNPGEYYFKEQFGGGTLVENTVQVYNDYMFLLSYDGLMMYDGTAVSPFKQPYVQEIMRRINRKYIDEAVAVVHNGIYSLALPLDDSEVNNAILEYNTSEGYFNLRTGVYVSSFLSYENSLYYTDSRPSTGLCGAVMKLDGTGESLPMRYVTAYQDLGNKAVVKSGFEVYLLSDNDMSITVGVRTEKKLKERTVHLIGGKAKKVRVNVAGRSFRLELAVPGGDHWKMSAGLQVYMELDPD